MAGRALVDSSVLGYQRVDLRAYEATLLADARLYRHTELFL